MQIEQINIKCKYTRENDETKPNSRLHLGRILKADIITDEEVGEGEKSQLALNLAHTMNIGGNPYHRDDTEALFPTITYALEQHLRKNERRTVFNNGVTTMERKIDNEGWNGGTVTFTFDRKYTSL